MPAKPFQAVRRSGAEALAASCLLVVGMLTPANAQPPATSRVALADEPTDFAVASQPIVAPTRIAWHIALAPDETWMATCHGHYQGDIGRIRICDLKSGQLRWEAREDRGVRIVAISPDGSVVVSGNYGGEIRIRDAATGQVRQTLSRTGGSTEWVAFSSDGRRLVTCGNRRTLRIFDLASGRVSKTFEGHTDAVFGARFSPDDKLLLSQGRDRTARIWNVEDGSVQHVLPHPGEVYAATFLPDGKRIATGCADGKGRVFEVSSGKLVTTLEPLSPQRLIYSVVTASPDGKLLAAGDATSIRIWYTNNWEPVLTLEPKGSFTWGLAFTKGSKSLLSAGSDSAIRVWDLPTKTVVREFAAPAGEQIGAGQVRALSVSPDGKLLASATVGGSVEIRNRETGELVHTLVARDPVTSLAFAPDSQTLVAAGSGLWLWDVKTGKLRETREGTSDNATAVAWSPEGKLLATGSADHVVRLVDATTGQQLAALQGHTGAILSVAFSSDGKRLASSSADHTGRVWDVEKWAAVATLQGHTAAVVAVAFANDGKNIATASDDGTIRLWGASSFRPWATLQHPGPTPTLAFLPGGRMLAAGNQQGAVCLWSVDQGVERQRLTGHLGPVTGLAFLPDGSGLISGSMDRSLRLWKRAAPATPALVAMPAHRPEATAAVFSPDGKWLMTAGADRAIALRDPSTCVVRSMLRGHEAPVLRLAASPDSASVASVSGDGTLRVWSLERGEETSIFSVGEDDQAPARAVVFSPDGRLIAAGADDGTIKLWNVAQKTRLHVFERQSMPITSLAFADGGSILASSTGDWQKNWKPGELRLWDAASGKELGQLKNPGSEIKCLAVDPAGAVLASSETNRMVRLYDVASRKELATIRLDAFGGCLAFSPHGDRLAIGHYSGSVTLWDVPAGTLVQRYAGHAKAVAGISFSPDGKVLATAGRDGRVSLWPTAEGREPNEN